MAVSNITWVCMGYLSSLQSNVHYGVLATEIVVLLAGKSVQSTARADYKSITLQHCVLEKTTAGGNVSHNQSPLICTRERKVKIPC